MIYKLQFLTLLLLLQFNNIKAQISLSTQEEVIQYLDGDWVLIEQCGGIAGICFPPSFYSYLSFEEISGVTDSLRYVKYDNGEFTSGGTTGIQLISSPNSDDYWELDLELDSDPFIHLFRLNISQPQNDTVSLSENYCADCFVNFYRRFDSTSNQEISNENNIEIFPNPSKEILNISSQSILDKVVIYDSSARKVLTRYQVNKTIDISELNSGIYFIEIHTSDKIQKSRFIKT